MGGIVYVDDEEPVGREALKGVGVASFQVDPDEDISCRQRAGKESQALVGVDENRIRRIRQQMPFLYRAFASSRRILPPPWSQR